MKKPDGFIAVKDAAYYLEISRQTLNNWNKIYPEIYNARKKIAGRVFYNKQMLDNFVMGKPQEKDNE